MNPELKALLQKLVEEPEQMTRMQLVEDSTALLEGLTTGTDGQEDWKTKYDELQKKYIDRFFNGNSEEAPDDENNDESGEGEEMGVDDFVDSVINEKDGEN